jgi:hypothetical protein
MARIVAFIERVERGLLRGLPKNIERATGNIETRCTDGRSASRRLVGANFSRQVVEFGHSSCRGWVHFSNSDEF